jgi:hypothetical protein
MKGQSWPLPESHVARGMTDNLGQGKGTSPLSVLLVAVRKTYGNSSQRVTDERLKVGGAPDKFENKHLRTKRRCGLQISVSCSEVPDSSDTRAADRLPRQRLLTCFVSSPIEW